MKLDLEPILNYTKKLYLEPDENGDHRYSLQNIADLIRRKFNVSYTKDSVGKWAKKYGWWTLWQDAVKKGITSAVKEEYAGKKHSKDKELDEKYEELISRKKRDDFLRATQLKILGFKYVQENGFNTVSDALRAIEIGMKYTEDLVIDIKTVDEEAKRIEESVESLREAIEFLDGDDSKKQIYPTQSQSE